MAEWLEHWTLVVEVAIAPLVFAVLGQTMPSTTARGSLPEPRVDAANGPCGETAVQKPRNMV